MHPPSSPRLSTIIVLGIAGSSVLLILPIFVGTLFAEGGLNTEQAGWIASADLFGYAVGSLVAFQFISRRRWRNLALIGLCGMILGNVASIFAAGSFELLMAIRIGLTGAGAGLVIAVPYCALSDQDETEKSTAHYWTFNVLGGSIGLLVLPFIVSLYGDSGLFLFLGAVAAAALPVAFVGLGSPQQHEEVEQSEYGVSFSGLTSKELLSLGSIAVFNIGLGGVWAFVDRPALSLGLSGTEVGWILSATYLICMLGSTVAAWQQRRLGLTTPYIVAMLVMGIAIFSLSGANTTAIYVCSLAAINFCWNYAMTYQFIAVYDISTRGNTASLIFFSQSLGLMLGPVFSGAVAASYSPSGAFTVAIGLCALSALAFWRSRHP